MNQQGRRTALGIGLAVALVIAGAVLVLGAGSETMQPRTPIDVASLGPQVGEQVPAFSLPDQNGEVQTLESIMGPNGAILLFQRSADW